MHDLLCVCMRVCVYIHNVAIILGIISEEVRKHMAFNLNINNKFSHIHIEIKIKVKKKKKMKEKNNI